jgi:hypothetical protein
MEFETIQHHELAVVVRNTKHSQLLANLLFYKKKQGKILLLKEIASFEPLKIKVNLHFLIESDLERLQNYPRLQRKAFLDKVTIFSCTKRATTGSSF